MKKLLTIVLMLTMVLSATACGSDQGGTEAEKDAAGQVAAADTTASAGVLSGAIKLNGAAFTLPCSIEDIEKSGLTVYEPDKELDANTLTPIILLDDQGNNSFVTAYFMNPNGGKAKDSMIYEVAYSYNENNPVPIEFAGGLTEKSTYDEVKATLESDKTYASNDSYRFDAGDGYVDVSLYEQPFYPDHLQVSFYEDGSFGSVYIENLSSAAQQ